VSTEQTDCSTRGPGEPSESLHLQGIANRGTKLRIVGLWTGNGLREVQGVVAGPMIVWGGDGLGGFG
jgi:hypothetical protein